MYGSARRESPSRSDGLPGLDASKLTISKTTTPQPLKDPKELVFGSSFTGRTLKSDDI